MELHTSGERGERRVEIKETIEETIEEILMSFQSNADN